MRKHIKSAVILSLVLTSLLFWGQRDSTWSQQQVKGLKGSKKAEAVEEVRVPEKLPGDRIDSFVATLSDEQVRRLLLEELQKRAVQAATTSEKEQSAGRGSILGTFFVEADGKASASFRRIQRIFRGSAAILSQPRALIGILSDGKGGTALLMDLSALVLLIGAGLMAEWLLLRLTENLRNQLLSTAPSRKLQRFGRVFSRILLDALRLVAFILITFVLFVIFFDKGNSSFTIVLTFLIVSYYFRVIMFLARVVFSPAAPGLRLVPMADEDAAFLYRWFFRISAVAAVIAGTSIIIKNLEINEELYLATYSAAGLSVILLLVIMIWQSRHRVAHAICRDAADGTCDYSPLRAGLAKSWHVLAILYVITMGVFWQIHALIEGKGTVLKLIASLFIIPLFIGIDQWGQRLLKVASGELPETFDLSEDEGGVADVQSPAADIQPERDERAVVQNYIPLVKRLFRIVLLVALFFLFLRLWGIDLAVTRIFSSTILSIIVALLIGLIVWEYSKTLIDHKLEEEFPDEDEDLEEGGAGGTRRGTLLLLLRKFVLTVLVVIIAMIVLSEIGVDIGPMIAGAGIVGLAIGFGAQTLVRDIISGIFFLLDDAFRVGDYVETAGIRGTVEKISLRSMRLRHHRGPIHTIPFGGMQSVTNYSRDYHIMKLDFRVRYDTDVDKVRKIIKKINKEIQRDETLAAGLLDKIKSQGVRALDDSAMIMRVKFKTVPGQQFVVRREVFKRMQEAFRENGIEFAHRNVTVYLPPEATSAPGDKEEEAKDAPTSPVDRKTLEAAAGAAALAATREQEDAKKSRKEEDDR